MATNITGVPLVTPDQLKQNDAATLNRALQLLAQKIQSVTALTAPAATGQTGPSVNRGPSAPVSSGSSTTSTVTTTGVVTIEDTHAARLAGDPSLSALGTYFYESDRVVTYLNILSGSLTQVWQWHDGTMRGTLASRPTDVSTYDAGFLYFATDNGLTYRWSGAAWSTTTNTIQILQDTHANRLASYLSVSYPTGTLFWETDRTVLYIAQGISGTVTTNNTTTVAWTSGDKFITTANWIGKTIVIGGISYTVTAVASTISLTVSVAIPVAAGVAYSVASGKWQYATGEFNCQQAALPADLISSDDGFIADVVNFYHRLRWDGPNATFNWAPGDGGSGYVQGFFVAPTANTGWALCNGTVGVSYLLRDGTTTTITVPNLIGTPAYPKFGNPYTGAIVAPVAPGITGTTALATAVLPPVVSAISNAQINGATAVDTGSGQIVQSGAGVTVAAHTHTHVITPATAPDSGHSHLVTVVDSGHQHTKGTLAADTTGEPQNIVLLPYFRR